jgi:hypothetical protein
VLLGVNMQTSFMHPPFGFALFYLRSVAPRKEYADKFTGKLTPPVTTGQIYWGAVPFVLIQVVMIGLVILFPKMVMVYKNDLPAVDPARLQQQLDLPGADQGGKPDDILKDLQQSNDKAGASSPPAEDPAKAIEQSIKGGVAPASGRNEKSTEDRAAEEIEKALRGGK